MVQNDKKFCLLGSISQKPCIIWWSFMVHVCKMMIYPGDFFIFSKFWFSGLWGAGGGWGKRAKNGLKLQKILSFALHMSGSIYHMIVILCTYVSNVDISSCFFHFFKMLIFQVIREVKGQKMVQNDKIFCLCHSIFEEL